VLTGLVAFGVHRYRVDLVLPPPRGLHDPVRVLRTGGLRPLLVDDVEELSIVSHRYPLCVMSSIGAVERTPRSHTYLRVRADMHRTHILGHDPRDPLRSPLCLIRRNRGQDLVMYGEPKVRGEPGIVQPQQRPSGNVTRRRLD